MTTARTDRPMGWGRKVKRCATPKEVVAKIRNGASPYRIGDMVYFVAAPELQLVKIGVARNAYTRFKDLCAQSPVELQFLTAVDGDVLLERALHKHFKALRVRGEWFRHEGELLLLILDIREAQEEAKARQHQPAFRLPAWVSTVWSKERVAQCDRFAEARA